MTSYSEAQVEAELIRDEGWKDRPYRDTVGKLTIGVGHNLDAEGLCREAILVQLRYDIQTKAVAPLDRHLPWWRSKPDPIQRALINLMFNMGPGVLMQFGPTLQLIHDNRYNEAADRLLLTKYAKQVGSRAIRVAKLLRSVLQ